MVLEKHTFLVQLTTMAMKILPARHKRQLKTFFLFFSSARKKFRVLLVDFSALNDECSRLLRYVLHTSFFTNDGQLLTMYIKYCSLYPLARYVILR